MTKVKNSYRAYSGIGARNTPEEILDEMAEVAAELQEVGFILRTGGALGADDAFLSGITDESMCELYLPWQGYNGFQSKHYKQSAAAIEQAFLHHPNWGACKESVRKLHSRNSHIVLGADCHSPSEFILCYTEGGKAGGGTGQAIRIADSNLIQVFDYGLGIDYTTSQLQQWMEKNL